MKYSGNARNAKVHITQFPRMAVFDDYRELAQICRLKVEVLRVNYSILPATQHGCACCVENYSPESSGSHIDEGHSASP